ncbi:hypothetical protein O181_004574 [Austropuccinia psidii MF-1]|uniref:Uncharacterized protein n=1 Tax=Austropuccinia psidii MF-1 TaxID=1389203 RepID=A0A9Q3GF05_9BASI|nr:hypothetical protein [Austropuccinia psidii MF-1]
MFPVHSGERLLSTNVLHTMDSGMVHIWYNMPLCTNFSQQSNGDGFRTKFCHFKTKSPNPTPILNKVFLVIQSSNPWRLPEDHLRTPTTWPCRSWVVLLPGFFQAKFQEVIKHSISFQGIKNFNTLCKTQFVCTGCIPASCMALGI